MVSDGATAAGTLHLIMAGIRPIIRAGIIHGDMEDLVTATVTGASDIHTVMDTDTVMVTHIMATVVIMMDIMAVITEADTGVAAAIINQAQGTMKPDAAKPAISTLRAAG